jgi:hypothetical protein
MVDQPWRAKLEGADLVGPDAPFGQRVKCRTSGAFREVVFTDAAAVKRGTAAADLRAVAGG